MVKPANVASIETATQTSWQEWCAFLDGANAATLDHGGIVKLAHNFRPVSAWWAQSVAVAYEQHIGRRLPGQTSDGLFSASVSRTITGSLPTAHEVWCKFAADLKAVGGLTISGPPTTSATSKRLYWRCRFGDGSTAAVGMEAKAVDKVLIGIEHKKLVQHADIKRLKPAWGRLLEECYNI